MNSEHMHGLEWFSHYFSPDSIVDGGARLLHNISERVVKDDMFVHRLSFVEEMSLGGFEPKQRKKAKRRESNSRSSDCDTSTPVGQSSKYRGVYWNSSAGNSGRWRARIWINGKSVHLGNYNSELEAARAFDKEALIQGRLQSMNSMRYDLSADE